MADKNNESEEEFDASLYGFDIHASFEIPVEWDILVSASDASLNGPRGFLEKEIIKQLPASITYRIWNNELGELGIIEIRKLRQGLSQIDISGISLNSEDTAPIWLRKKPEWDKRIKDITKGLSKKEEINAYLAISKEMDKEKRRIKARQRNHQSVVINSYFSRLERENIWPNALETLETVSYNAITQKIKGGRPRNANDDWAYEQVRVLGRDKHTVYNEWLEKIGDRRTSLSSPKDSFNKAVSPKRSKRN